MKLGILWDMDGTLLDTLQDLADSTNAALAHFGYPRRTLEEVRRFVGNGAWRLIRLSMPDEEPDAQVDEVLKYYQAYYREHCRIKTKPYDGVLQALALLGEKYPMAVVSNKPDPAVKALAKEYFPGLYALGESDLCPRKPAPDMVYQAMRALGVDRCIYVGDSEVDVLTAENAGVPCLSVTWGFRDASQLEEAGGRYFCHETKELPKALEGIAAEVFGNT